ncbi:MAG: hypothetical protein GY796_15910 [Chloroflexi bacterium]|nr:hypothetical protein [Chloroflexota bacterium]
MMAFLEKYLSFIAFVIAIVLIISFGLWGSLDLNIRWLLIMGVIILFFAFIGREKTAREYTDSKGEKKKTFGRFDGVWIDPRNKISLSRFQIILWTVVALSAWATLVLHRTIPILESNMKELTEPIAASLVVLLEEGGVEIDEDDALSLIELLSEGEEDLLDIDYEALNVSFPQELILALGISTASLAGSAIIKTNKSRTETGSSLEIFRTDLKKAKDRLKAAQKDESDLEARMSDVTGRRDGYIKTKTTANPDYDPAKDPRVEDYNSKLENLQTEAASASAAVSTSQNEVNELETVEKDKAGLIHINESVEDARWSDILSGELISNYQLTDIAKVQMFFFTIIIVFTYATLIWAQMSSNEASRALWILPSVSLPTFSESLVVLLGLSHGGYLAVKSTS